MSIKTLQKLEIVYLPIDEVKPNSYNPNRQSDKDFELLCRSIEEDGFTQPIIVLRETKTIVDGEHRWRAMKALGKTQVPVVMVEMDQAQAMISTLRHNRARGEENIAKAADVIKELQDLGALDSAADGLMMDDVEIELFTMAIPEAELHIRTPKMTVGDVNQSIEDEAKFEKEKQEENLQMVNEDSQGRFILQMIYVTEEAQIVKSVIGKQVADGLLTLCKEADRVEI